MAAINDIRGAIIAGAMTAGAIGSGPLSGVIESSTTDPDVRDAVSSLTTNVHESLEAVADDAERRDEVSDTIENPITEPDVVEQRDAEEADEWGEPADAAELSDEVEGAELDEWGDATDSSSDSDEADATNG